MEIRGLESHVSLSTGHRLDRSDPSTHLDRSEILTHQGQSDKLNPMVRSPFFGCFTTDSEPNV